ncbi:MAG: hypothetical protein ACRDHV_05155 [Actinomycetota bacterium]
MVRRRSTFVLTLAVVWTVTAASVATAHHDGEGHTGKREISADMSNAHLLDPAHHGPNIGHLPSDVENVNLVSRLKLTDVEGGIADVGYYKGYAYLNAWFPECTATGGTGGGVHVVDVRNPANPVKVGFLPSETNAVPGEGIHIMTVSTPSFQGDLLFHNNEQCDGTLPADLGMSIWDVTNPLAPTKLSQWGDDDPPAGNTTYHSIHSVQGFTQPGKAFAVMVDNIEFPDVDIVDVTNPAAPVMASETDLSDWPDAQSPLANGSAAFLHDMQFKRIGGTDYVALSYWDAGQVILNVNDPANPVFVGDSDYIDPDPETGHAPPEGNSHQSYWSSNNQFLLSSDEDFSTFRLEPPGFEVTSGPNVGGYEGGEFSFSVPISSRPGNQVNGSTVFGGRGCVDDGDPAPPTASAIETANPGFWGAGEEKTIVFSRGLCFFSDKVRNGELAGYDVVLIGNSHAGSGAGTSADAAFCGGQGSPVLGIASGLCIGHRVMHLLFNDMPEYTGVDGLDIPLGELGEEYRASAVFDGWGYVQLHDATQPNLPILDTYVIREALDPRFAQGFGDLTVHEVKTDPRLNVNLAYFSYYSGGFRVAEFGPGGITEVGMYIADEGNDFWGVFPIGDELAGHGYPNDQPYTKPLILASDRTFGLYIFQYTGSAGTCRGQEVTMLGTEGNDVLTGTPGRDVINGLGGNDKVNGLGGNDRLCGGPGKDKLKGAGGKDFLNGGPGKDRCNGGPGRDKAKACEKEKNIP